MSRFLQTIDASAVAVYPASPQVAVPFEPRTVRLELTGDSSNDAIALISEDGVNDDYVLDSAADGGPVIGQTIAKKFWVRSTAGAVVKVVFQVGDRE